MNWLVMEWQNEVGLKELSKSLVVCVSWQVGDVRQEMARNMEPNCLICGSYA